MFYILWKVTILSRYSAPGKKHPKVNKSAEYPGPLSCLGGRSEGVFAQQSRKIRQKKNNSSKSRNSGAQRILFITYLLNLSICRKCCAGSTPSSQTKTDLAPNTFSLETVEPRSASASAAAAILLLRRSTLSTTRTLTCDWCSLTAVMATRACD